MGSFLKLKKVLEEKDDFLLVCHEKVDGDAAGALLAMGEILKQKGKRSALISKDNLPEIFNFLPGIEKIESRIKDEKYGTIVLVDNGDFKRTGFSDELARLHQTGIPIINIDHHTKNDIWKIADINYAEEKASSTCEIIYKLCMGLRITMTPNLATLLLTGIYYDTGGFQHQNTTKEVFIIVSDLLRRGAKLKKISENFSQRNISMLKLWGLALDRIKFNAKYGITYSFISGSDIKSVGACEEDVSGLVNLLNKIPEARLSLLLYESENGNIKGSLRTEKEDVDVARLANIFGGGGHKKAAGFTFPGQIQKASDGWRII